MSDDTAKKSEAGEVRVSSHAGAASPAPVPPPPLPAAVEQKPAAAAPVQPLSTVPAKRIVAKHPLAIRWFHWINFPVLFLMIWSGSLILWANDAYPIEEPIHIGGRSISLRFHMPERISIYKWGVATIYGDTPDPDNKPAPPGQRYDFTFGERLAEGMGWHFTFAWLFITNGLAYVLYLLVSGEWRVLVPMRNSFKEAIHVVLHDLRLSKKPLPPGKFNHAQRIAYSGVVVLGALMIVTGFAIYKPAQLAWLAALLGGYQAARTEHFLITVLFLLFFLVHIAQVIRAGWNNFRAMITGFEIVKAPPVPTSTPAAPPIPAAPAVSRP